MLTPANIHDSFRFRLSVSNECYGEKPLGAVVGRMRWHSEYIDVHTLAEYIRCGRTFFILSRNKETSAYLKSNLLFIDIDHAQVTFEECLDRLPYKPTIAYKSYWDNLVPGDWKYRIVYVFDRPYTGLQHKALYDCMKEALNLTSIVGEKTPDGKEIVDYRVPNQYYNGTNKETVEYGAVYTLPDGLHPQTFEEYMAGGKKKDAVKFGKDAKLFQKETLDAYKNSTLMDFVETMEERTGLQLQVETSYEKGGDDRIYVKPENYYRLPVKTRWNKAQKRVVTLEWSDGEQRHRKLYLAGLVLRRMSDYTPDELLYLLCCYVMRYIDNTDGKFTRQYIYGVCLDCLSASLDNALTEVKASAYHVDPAYAYRTRQSKRQIIGQLNGERMAKEREQRYAKIDKWYDAALTDKQNLANLKKHRVNVSRSTLTRYKKDRRLSPKDNASMTK